MVEMLAFCVRDYRKYEGGEFPIDIQASFVRCLPRSEGGGRPERFVIFSRRADPPALILASRRSRRIRACLWAASSPGGEVGSVEAIVE